MTAFHIIFIRLNKILYRTLAAPLGATASLLKDYELLEKHFEWVMGGSIRRLVKQNLYKELQFLEKYLRDLGRTDITAVLNEAIEKGETDYYEFGETFRWVGVLRAAQQVWTTTDNEHPLFRMESEGVSSMSPQILVKAWNR
jgi:hypothetical protein